MNRRNIIIATITLLAICNMAFAQVGASGGNGKLIAPMLPNPKLVYAGKEVYTANGKQFTRYKLKVTNFAAYPAAMFAASPSLPACGSNTSASRTWVDIFDSATNQRLYGFCALGQSQDLTELWFAVEVGKRAPQCVHIVMTDRRLNKKYISNRVCIPRHEDPAPELKPDLMIQGFKFANDPNKTLLVQVRNIGNKFSAPCVLRLTVRRINDIPVGRTTEVQVPAIQKGDSVFVKISAKQILPNNVQLKDTTFRLNIDATSLVAESNEGNNEVWHNLNP